jgi:hypothetical protein
MADDPTRSPLWPTDSPAVIAYVNLLQGVINRLAGNSASCKTWCLALVGALLSLAGVTHVPGVVTFVLVPVVIFGFLDAMYLAQERAYRKLFGRVVNLIHTDALRREHLFDARAPLELKEFVAALKSWSIFPVYLTLIAGYIVVAAAGWLTLLAAPGK